MAQKLHVEGYDELQKALQDNQGNMIFVLFTGSVGAGGQSWCPDCVKGTVYESSWLAVSLFLIHYSNASNSGFLHGLIGALQIGFD